MKIKNLFKKVIVSIIIFMIVLGSFGTKVKAEAVDFSSAYLIDIVYDYYSNKENNDALPDSDPLKGYQDDALLNNITTTINNAWGMDPSGFINDFQTTYSTTSGSETEKNKAALLAALLKIPQFNGTANSIVNYSQSKISEDAGDNTNSGDNTNTGDGQNTGDNSDSGNTGETGTVNVDQDYIKQLLYDYYTSPEYANVNGGVSADVAEQKAQDLVDKYGAQMVEAYSNAYNNSTLTDEEERRNYAFQQAIAVTNGEDAILDGDVTNDGSGVVAAIGNGIGAFLNGIVGVFFYFVKLLPLAAARILMSIMGLAINGSDSVISGLSLDQILFNEVPILGINFFETATGANAATINLIREQVSIWYVAIRNIAAVILAVMALYIGIRMAISSVAEEKARYKRMLTDWVVSIVLLFVLHYIMILIININDGLVEVLKIARKNSTNSSTVMSEAFSRAISFSDMFSFTAQLANMAIYVMLAVMTFIFFCTYVKRMVTIAFLIMISPLITVTYSIDRMGDGKSQALNTWFKNFVYNILLQPFQCITYLALVQTAINSMNIGDLSTVVVAIVMVFFLFEAEEIIKDIFHFQGKSVAQTIAQAALVTSAIGAVSKAATAGAGKVKGYASRGNPNANQNQATPQTGAGAAAGIQAATGAGGANGITAGTGAGAGIGAAATGVAGGTGAGAGAAAAAAVASNATAQPPSGNNGGASGNKGNKVLRAIGGAAKFGFKQAGKLPLAVMLAAAGLATGRVENAISGFNTGMDISRGVISGMEENANLRKFAKDYKNLAGQIYQGKDDAWIRDHTKALLDGSVQYQPYEKAYYDLVRGEQDRYIDSGFSADDAITQVEQNVAGVQRGNISEISSVQRFKGKIKNKFGRRP